MGRCAKSVRSVAVPLPSDLTIVLPSQLESTVYHDVRIYLKNVRRLFRCRPTAPKVDSIASLATHPMAHLGLIILRCHARVPSSLVPTAGVCVFLIRNFLRCSSSATT